MKRICALLLQMEQSDVERLALTDSRIVIARLAGDPPVAWIVERPGTVTWLAWDERCGLYASESQLRGRGAIDIRSSLHPAADRALYSYAFGAFRSRAADLGIPAAHYEVRNAARVAATFGLLQAATVNGVRRLAPLCAAVLPPGFVADFTAPPALALWLDRAVEAGSVIARVPANALRISYRAADCLSYRYDRGWNTFTDAPAVAIPRRTESGPSTFALSDSETPRRPLQ